MKAGDDPLQHLRHAVELGRVNLDSGDGGPFGALIVRDGVVLGEGRNQVLRSHDPTAHAEIVAIRRACQAVSAHHLHGAALYSSCEPCPMCLAAAHWAHIDRVYFAATRDAAAAAGFIDAELYALFQQPGAASAMPRLHLPLAEADAALAQWQRSPWFQPY